MFPGHECMVSVASRARELSATASSVVRSEIAATGVDRYESVCPVEPASGVWVRRPFLVLVDILLAQPKGQTVG